MTKSVYEEFDAILSDISAFTVARGDKVVGRLVFKAKGQKLYCFFHLYGQYMVSGTAGGYGYDKMSTSFLNCLSQLDCQAAGYGENNQKLKDCANDSFKKGYFQYNYIMQECGYTLYRVI